MIDFIETDGFVFIVAFFCLLIFCVIPLECVNSHTTEEKTVMQQELAEHRQIQHQISNLRVGHEFIPFHEHFNTLPDIEIALIEQNEEYEKYVYFEGPLQSSPTFFTVKNNKIASIWKKYN